MVNSLAMYLRLSQDDVDLKDNLLKDESDSIGSQRLLIQRYIREHADLRDLSVVEFVDDGFTGTNFERPEFKRMLEAVKNGDIACIIVKDLSRFGRNYLEVGDYLEHIFPFLGVRFISVNKGITLNADYIAEFENNCCILSNGSRFPVRIRDRRKTEQAVEDYNFWKIRSRQGHRT